MARVILRKLSEKMHADGYVTTQEAAELVGRANGGSFPAVLRKYKVEEIPAGKIIFWKREDLLKVPPATETAVAGGNARHEEFISERIAKLARVAIEELIGNASELDDKLAQRVDALEAAVVKLEAFRKYMEEGTTPSNG